MIKRTLVTLCSVCCLSIGTLLGSSITIGTDNSSNDFPFSGPFFGYPPQGQTPEYQEAYAASDFSGPIDITAVDFFLGAGFAGTLYAGTYTLSFSTISADIGSLSSTNLASNIGADNTVFEVANLSGSAPSVLTFTGTTPFSYNPTAGNLLLDISIANGHGGSGAAYQDNSKGAVGVGTQVARYQNFGLNNGDGYGLVTEFDSNVANATTPEPGTLSLMACLGLVGLLVQRLRRSRLN